MQIVMSFYALNLGGTESYVLTVAEQLQRLGHDVTLFSVELGPNAAVARDRGLELRNRADELPPSCDVLYTQDSVTAYELAERYPETPHIYAAHADEYDLVTPPQVPGVVQAVVVLNDRLERQVRALAVAPEVVRLRQPVDVKRFYPRAALRDPPQRALILSNYLSHDRVELVYRACADAGIECRQIGAPTGVSTDEADVELCRADIVFGKSRVIVEAMASGRAAYVYDHNGGDGWVTPERYDLLEADNFGGQAEATATDHERLRRDLAAYSTQMGPANRDLAVANHSARGHAHELVEVFERFAGRHERIDAPLAELSRLARLQWANEVRAVHLAAENQRLRDQLDHARARNGGAGRRVTGRRLRGLVRRLTRAKRREDSAHSI
jgi:glycosyltransferase involved in cell wall biosynthesis